MGCTFAPSTCPLVLQTEHFFWLIQFSRQKCFVPSPAAAHTAPPDLIPAFASLLCYLDKAHHLFTVAAAPAHVNYMAAVVPADVSAVTSFVLQHCLPKYGETKSSHSPGIVAHQTIQDRMDAVRSDTIALVWLSRCKSRLTAACPDSVK